MGKGELHLCSMPKRNEGFLCGGKEVRSQARVLDSPAPAPSAFAPSSSAPALTYPSPTEVA
jgi:hypothetical protein